MPHKCKAHPIPLADAKNIGFYYYSAPAYLFMNIIVSILYLSKGQCSNWKFISLVLFSFIVFFLCATRLQLLVNIIMFIAYLVIYKTNWTYFTGKRWLFFSILSYPLMALLIYYAFSDSDFFDKDLLFALNLIFNGRLYFNIEAFEKYDVLWNGNDVNTSTGTTLDDYFFIDCGYIDVLIRYGYLITILLLVFFSIAYYKIYRGKEAFLYFYMLLFVFTSFVNNFFLASPFFPLPLLFGCSLANNELLPSSD